MPILVLPDPSLVLLVGAAGSGKSTLAARHFGPDEVLSSDALRERIAGDAADQRASAAAFRVLHHDLERRLAAGRLTVVDATNAVAGNRRSLLERARAAGVPVAAIVLHLAPAIVQARNAGRARVVDREVVERQLRNVAATVAEDRLGREGIAPVIVLRTPDEVDRLTIERRPR